jgi:hypothetical protein
MRLEAIPYGICSAMVQMVEKEKVNMFVGNSREQIEENENCKVNVFGNSNSNAYTECCSKKKMHIQSKRRDKNVLINNVKDNMSFFMESVHVEDNILI